MLKNIVSKFSDRGKEHPISPENSNVAKVTEGFLCPKCLRSFSNAELLQSHYEVHHEDGHSEPPSAVTLQNCSVLYDDSAAEIVEESGGSSGDVSPDVDVFLSLDENELKKRLVRAIQSNSSKDQKIKMLESRVSHLMHECSSLRTNIDKEKGVQNALQERIKVLEAQLNQRASLDDATALRQGLIQVQQAMDQMALDREKERDEYKEKLQCLEDTVNQEAEHMVQDKEKLSRVVTEYQQLHTKLKSLRERIVNAQLLINTNQFSSYEHALRRVNIQLEWLKSASKDAIITNFRELKALKVLVARGNREIISQEEDEELVFEPDISVGPEFVPEELEVFPENLKSDELSLNMEKLASEDDGVTHEFPVKEQELVTLEKEINVLHVHNKEFENAIQRDDTEDLRSKIMELEKELHYKSSQLSVSCKEEEVLKNTLSQLKQEKSILESNLKELGQMYVLQRQDNGKTSDKISCLENKLKELNSDLTESCSQKDVLIKKVTELEQENSTLEDEIKILQEKYNSQEEQISYLGVQRTSVETSLFELQKSFTELELEKANAHKSFSTKISQLEVEKSQLQSELEEIKVREERARENCATHEVAYRVQVEMLEKEIEHLLTKSRDLEKEMVLQEELKNNIEEQMGEMKNIIKNFEIQLEEQKKCHQQEVDDMKNALEMKQTALDEVAGEKLALEAQIETLQMERKALLERCYASTAEAEQLRRTHVEACRSQEEVQAALQELGRENQTLQMKMDKLLGRKWAEDSEVTKCTECEKEFSLIVRKHHCRNCFKIFCNECSSRVAAIEVDKKPVRVCDLCYNELSHK